MGKKTIMVLRWDANSVSEANKDEFVKWYYYKHVADIRKALPGVKKSELYECVRGRKKNPRFLSMVEIEGVQVMGGLYASSEAVAAGQELSEKWGGTVVSAAGYERCSPDADSGDSPE